MAHIQDAIRHQPHQQHTQLSQQAGHSIISQEHPLQALGLALTPLNVKSRRPGGVLQHGQSPLFLPVLQASPALGTPGTLGRLMWGKGFLAPLHSSPATHFHFHAC